MRAAGYLLVTLGAFTGCGGTEPDIPRLGGTQYDLSLYPALPTSRVGDCDRALTRVFMILSRRGTFELQVAAVDHCPSRTHEWRYFAPTVSGGYYLDGDRIDFLPNLSLIPTFVYTERGNVIDTLPLTGFPAFSGKLEGEFLRLNLPPEFGLASSPLEVLIGPGEPS